MIALASLPLLTDENIAEEVVHFLRQRNFEVLDVKENHWYGWEDAQILALAHQQQRIVITQDSDFGQLALAAQQPFTGIIYLKPGHIRPQFTIESIMFLLDHIVLVRPPFVIVVQHSPKGIKIRYRPK